MDTLTVNTKEAAEHLRVKPNTLEKARVYGGGLPSFE